MARNIIRLAGGNYSKLKSLMGDEALKDREVVVAKDTNELYVGKGNGEYSLLGNVHIGKNKADINSVDPEKGRFYFVEQTGMLYIGTGTGWKRAGVIIPILSGLELNEETGELKVKVDNNSIIINNSGNLAVKNTDFGVF